MFKLSQILFVFCLFSQASYGASQVTLRHNPIHGLWNFALALTEAPHTSEKFRKLFTESKENTLQCQAAIHELAMILERDFQSSFSRVGFPTDRSEQSWEIFRFFLLQSGKAKTLEEFESRVATLLPAADQQQLFSSLRTLAPVYDKLVWRPLLPKLVRNEKKLRQLLLRSHWGELLDRARKFYGASWPDSLEFDIVLMPVPGAGGHTNGTVVGNMGSAEVPVEETDQAGRLGVVFHEICHALYESQPEALQLELARWFKENPSDFSHLASSYLNEGLATAIGNGWSFEKMTGKTDPQAWYTDTYIDGFAHALYDEVSRRLATRMRLDAQFVGIAVKSFAEKFPGAFDDPRIRLSEIVIGSDPGLLETALAKKLIRKIFRLPSVFSSSDLKVVNLGSAMKDAPASATVVLVTGPKTDLGSVRELFPSMAKAFEVLKEAKAAAVIARKDKGNRMIYVFRVENGDELSGLAGRLKAAGSLPSGPDAMPMILEVAK